MNWLDYLVIVLYIGLMLGMGYFMREQKSAKSYFVGDKNFGWFSLLLSTMATQLSAISFISAPAFVGLKQGGGMKITPTVRRKMQPELDALIASARKIATRHNVGVRAVLNMGVASVSGVHLGDVPLDFIPVGDA